MNFSNLTPDTIYEISAKLKGTCIIRLCASDSYLERLCKSSRFDSLWRRKLLEDYNISYDGVNPYMEYLYTTHFYNQKYWTVSYYPIRSDPSPNREHKTILFRSRDEAVKYIYNYIKSTGFDIDSRLDKFYDELNKYNASTIVGDDILLDETIFRYK